MENDSPARREAAARPRLLGAGQQQDGETIEFQQLVGPDRQRAPSGGTERGSTGVHQRHMPMEPLKFHIPRKAKEKRALFQYVSIESREYEDMLTILSSSYRDTGSTGCFTYCKPRLIHSELLEKEFVEKRREMKMEGRTDKEMEESHCFLLADAAKLPSVCEKGLFVGHSRITALGNPSKGVYLSKHSDLLQVNLLNPGAMGEIIIFKVLKGKVKSIYENMSKCLLDPTPRFDSHLSKNSGKVTSLTSFRAFELTQQYFYEYSFAELRSRPRHVCPYAVVSFQYKGKDSPLPSIPLAPLRLNSQSAEGSKERAQYIVWTGDLVKGDKLLFQIALRSFSPPFLPYRLPDKLEIGKPMRFDHVTTHLPSSLFSWNLYTGSHEVVKNGHYCRLLEVIDRNRSGTSVTKLLEELETERVVLVPPLADRGFLFLLSSVQMATPTERGEGWKRCLQALFVFPETRDVTNSVQMATPTERGEGWKRCLQALFVFPETRDVTKSTSTCASSSHDASVSCSSSAVMPRLSHFLPALHHAVFKVRANPPTELSAAVELQAREYLSGLNDAMPRHFPMDEYDPKLDERGKLFPAPKHHRVNMDVYLRSYLYSPAHSLLSVARAKQMVEQHCGPKETQEGGRSRGSRGEGKEEKSNAGEEQTNPQKMHQLINLVLSCKRNAEREVRKEGGGRGGQEMRGTKRKLEQELAERTLKYLRRASQEAGGDDRVPAEGGQDPASLCSLSSVIGSVGLKDVDLTRDGSEAAAKLVKLLTDLNRAAMGSTNESQPEEQGAGQSESCPFGRLATKLGLPTNCDIDLRKQEELEEQTAGSVSSLEGFSPSSHSGESTPRGAAARGGGGGARRTGGGDEEEEDGAQIPWVLIPITFTGLCSERYTQRERDIPQDPRFLHVTTATGAAATTSPLRRNATPSPESSPPPSRCSSPGPTDLSPANEADSLTTEEQLAPTAPWAFAVDGSPLSSVIGSVGSKDVDLRMDGAEAAAKILSLLTGMTKEQEETHQEEKGEPSLPPAPERRDSSPQPVEKRQEEKRSVKEAEEELSEEGKESEPDEQVKKKEEGDAEEGRRKEGEVDVQVLEEAAGDEEHKGEVIDLIDDEEHKGEVIDLIDDEEHMGEVIDLMEDCSPPPPPPSLPLPLRDVNNILKEHLGDFSSEVQHLLQEQHVHYSSPHDPHTSACTHTPPGALTRFSEYVSFYNPCPPVQDYVSVLQQSISSIVLDSQSSLFSPQANARLTDADATLASSVDAFVAGIRMATPNCSDAPAASDGAAVSQNPPLSRGGRSWLQNTLTEPFPRNPSFPPSHVPLPAPTAASVCPPSYDLSDLVESPSPGSVPPPTTTTTSHTGPLTPPALSSGASYQPQQQPCIPQQHLGVEVNRTVGREASPLRQTPDNNCNQTVYCPKGGGGESSRPPESGGVPRPSTEPSDPPEVLPGRPLAESLSCPASVSIPGLGAPASPATALSSLISQLQPEVFSSLVEIIKDVKRNSLQFYIHSTEPEDQVYDQVKDYLLKQGNVEQTPVAFLDQEDPDNRLMVIIQNKDIAGHIHKIPALVSLKHHPSVVFVGIDSLLDVKNNSYNELFVSGGCIVSDEFVLNPDFITHERLSALLMFLEQQSSPECVWRWRIHCKTQKRLKEQARFKRDAGSLLDVLLAYQKRLIVEFLPYHHCDMMSRQSPNLDCLIDLQARYTHHRHIIFLTERRFEMFPNYSSSGIVIANIDDITHNFASLVGYNDIKNKQPITDDRLAPKGPGSRRLSHEDSVLSSELSPAPFPEHNIPFSSVEHRHHHHLHQQPCPGLHPPVDQLVPESATPPSSSSSTSNDGPQPHSDPDFEALRLAISQFRAERHAQQKQQQHLDPQAEFSINPLQSFLPKPTPEQVRLPPGDRTAPSISQGGPGKQIQLTPGRKAVAVTLESIHSVLEPEGGEEEEEEEREARERATVPVEGGGRRGSRDQSDVIPASVMGSLGGERFPSNSDRSLSGCQDSLVSGPPTDNTTSTNQNTDPASTVSNDCLDLIRPVSDRIEKPDRGEPAFPNMAKEAGVPCSTPDYLVGGDRARDRQPGQEQPIGRAAPPGNQDCRNTTCTMITAGGTTVTCSMSTVPNQEEATSPVLPRLQQLQRQIQEHQLQLQQQNHQQQQQQQLQNLHQQQLHRSQPQRPHHPPPQRVGALLPHPGNLALFPNQPFPPGPILGHLAALGGMRGLLGPGAIWPGSLGPAGAAALVWGLQQSGREFPGPALLGGFHNPGGQGSNGYRGGHRGGFNGM